MAHRPPRVTRRKTDRDLLLNGLASVNGVVAIDTWEKTLVLGNLHLFFDSGGKLNCLRILESDGKDRMYAVQEPQEILGDRLLPKECQAKTTTA